MPASIADINRSLIQVPLRSLSKRYQRVAGVEKCHAAAVLTEYKRFLVCKVLASDYDDALLAAPLEVGRMWREHVLDTAHYGEHCRAIAGKVLHHNPDVDDDAKEHAKRAKRALLAYEKHFEPPGPLWVFGELVPLSAAELKDLDTPPPKKAKGAASASEINVAVQAPFLPLRTVKLRSDETVHALFTAFVSACGASHLVPGRQAVPPTTRLRHGNDWLHDLQVLGESGVKEGDIVYVAAPRERRSRDELAITVNDIASGSDASQTATVYVKPADTVLDLMKQVQDTMGAPHEAQSLIFAGQILKPTATVAGCALLDGSRVQMAVGKRRSSGMTMSPGGTWRQP